MLRKDAGNSIGKRMKIKRGDRNDRAMPAGSPFAQISDEADRCAAQSQCNGPRPSARMEKAEQYRNEQSEGIVAWEPNNPAANFADVQMGQGKVRLYPLRNAAIDRKRQQEKQNPACQPKKPALC